MGFTECRQHRLFLSYRSGHRGPKSEPSITKPSSVKLSYGHKIACGVLSLPGSHNLALAYSSLFQTLAVTCSCSLKALPTPPTVSLLHSYSFESSCCLASCPWSITSLHFRPVPLPASHYPSAPISLNSLASSPTRVSLPATLNPRPCTCHDL